MKYLYILIFVLVAWLIFDQVILKAESAGRELSLWERIREFGTNLHYVFGALALIIIILFAVRFVFLALKSP